MILVALVAAQITTVAGAGGENPFGLELEATYWHLRSDATISRERTTAAGIVLGDELRHTRILDTLELRLSAGVWRDLEVHLVAPLALRDSQEWSALPGGTLAGNTINISGCGAPGLCTAVQPIGVVPGQSGR